MQQKRTIKQHRIQVNKPHKRRIQNKPEIQLRLEYKISLNITKSPTTRIQKMFKQENPTKNKLHEELHQQNSTQDSWEAGIEDAASMGTCV